MRRLLVLTSIVSALVAAGCGDDDPGGEAMAKPARAPATTPAAAPADAQRPARRGTTIRVVDSQFGRILAARRGQAVYLFDKERTRRSECYGACAKAWPPVLTKGRPAAGKGAK